MSSDSSDSDSDEINYDEQIAEVKNKLSENPFDYNARLELVKLYRAANKLEELREERDELATRFPLQESVWRQWLADEEKLLFRNEVISYRDVQNVIEIFDRAVADYLSVDIWLDYCSFMERVHFHDASDENEMDADDDSSEPLVSEDEVRAKYEEALTLLAFHIPGASRVWDAYRKFEKEVMNRAASAGKEAVVAAQVERIDKLYQRQLHLPHINMEEAYAEYVEWKKEHGGQEVDPALVEAYESALVQLADRADYELNVHSTEDSDPLNPDYSKLEHWRSYIKFEESVLHAKKTNPARTRCLYERALKQYYLVLDLWESYSFFMLEHYKKNLDQVIDVQMRGIRNYPYSHSLWCHAIHTMDKANAPSEDINALFERAQRSGLQSAHDFLQVYKFYCNHRINRIDWNDEEQRKALRALFDSSATYFYKYFPDHAADLEKYFALIEERKFKDTEAAMARWENIVNKSGKVARNWLDAINFALRQGDVTKARNLFKRAQSTHTDQPEEIWKAWLDFELVEGSSSDVGLALNRCTKAQREQEQKYYAQQIQAGGAAESLGEAIKEEPDKAKRKKRKVEDMEGETQEPASRKRRKVEEERPEPPSSKRHDEKFTIFVSNLSYKTDNESLERFFSSVENVEPPKAVRLVRDRKTGKSRCFAYIQFGSDEEVQKVVAACNGKVLDGRSILVAPSKPPTTKSASTSAPAPRTAPRAPASGGAQSSEKASMPPPVAPARPLIPRAVQRKRIATPTMSTTQKQESTPAPQSDTMDTS